MENYDYKKISEVFTMSNDDILKTTKIKLSILEQWYKTITGQNVFGETKKILIKKIRLAIQQSQTSAPSGGFSNFATTYPTLYQQESLPKSGGGGEFPSSRASSGGFSNFATTYPTLYQQEPGGGGGVSTYSEFPSYSASSGGGGVQTYQGPPYEFPPSRASSGGFPDNLSDFHYSLLDNNFAIPFEGFQLDMLHHYGLQLFD